MKNLSFRPAIPAERTALEDLQWRASLMWEDYRDALLENPDAIDLPLNQITDGRAIVAEMLGEIVGFAVVLPRDDGHAELDALFVEPKVWRPWRWPRADRRSAGICLRRRRNEPVCRRQSARAGFLRGMRLCLDRRGANPFRTWASDAPRPNRRLVIAVVLFQVQRRPDDGFVLRRWLAGIAKPN
jgi:hypothetical protein